MPTAPFRNGRPHAPAASSLLDDLLSTEDVCRVLGVTDRSLRRWRLRGLVHVRRIATTRRVFYSRAEIEALLRLEGRPTDVGRMAEDSGARPTF